MRGIFSAPHVDGHGKKMRVLENASFRASPARVAKIATHYSFFFILATHFSLYTSADHLF
jgi:hypothetical protein